MLEIRPIAGALGGEIYGIDLTVELTEENSQRIRKLLNEYEVIFFRDQNISPAMQKCMAFCTRADAFEDGFAMCNVAFSFGQIANRWKWTVVF